MSSSPTVTARAMGFPGKLMAVDRRSTAIRVSYKLGACNIIPAVPPIQANVNIQRKNLSRTIATYFQSSITYE